MAALRHYYLGMAVNYAGAGWLKHLFTGGRKREEKALEEYLAKRYGGEVILCKNGRSALCLALRAYFDKGDAVIVNGFTCYAVIEAVKAAGLTPVFADISREDLNFNTKTLEKAPMSHVKGIIVQNTLGNPVDIRAVEKFAKKHHLTIIEDLAHCTGVKYNNKHEVGTVGAACVMSFGKDKSVDTISGGAVVLREAKKHEIKTPSMAPKPSDHLRAKFYPMFGTMSRALTHLGLGGVLMRGLVKIHWVEKSADSKLDTERRPSKFEAKLALKQFKELRRTGEPPLRDFYFVRDRGELLKKLQKKGYYFGGFWYEKPVSPERYYKKVHFPEKDCPDAVWVAEHIINLPNCYTRRDLVPALKIIKEYLEEEDGR